jgi:hypothetical protein
MRPMLSRLESHSELLEIMKTITRLTMWSPGSAPPASLQTERSQASQRTVIFSDSLTRKTSLGTTCLIYFDDLAAVIDPFPDLWVNIVLFQGFLDE